jgi:hypothetical protein
MGWGRIRVVAVAVTATLVASGAVAGAAPSTTRPQPSDMVSAQPAPGSHLAPHSGYYQLGARAGATVTQTLTIVNTNKHAVDVRLAGADGLTTEATGAAYTSPSQTPTKAGAWISVATPELTMQPGEQRDVDFSVHVPPKTKPGYYLAGLAVWVPLAAGPSITSPSGNHARFAITLQGERVIGVVIVVPGPARAQLDVHGVKAAAGRDGLVLDMALANTGNAFARGSGVVTVPDTKFSFPFKINTFVSHTEINYAIPWTATIVPGVHEVSVKLTYDGRRVTTWDGTVNITGTAKQGLERALRDARVGPPAPSHSSSSALVAAIALAVALACVVGAVMLRRRRRRETPSLAV